MLSSSTPDLPLGPAPFNFPPTEMKWKSPEVAPSRVAGGDADGIGPITLMNDLQTRPLVARMQRDWSNAIGVTSCDTARRDFRFISGSGKLNGAGTRGKSGVREECIDVPSGDKTGGEGERRDERRKGDRRGKGREER